MTPDCWEGFATGLGLFVCKEMKRVWRAWTSWIVVIWWVLTCGEDSGDEWVVRTFVRYCDLGVSLFWNRDAGAHVDWGGLMWGFPGYT